MAKNYVHLGVTKEVKRMLIEDCIKLYLHHHPEMNHIKISVDKILYEVCNFYLK